MEASVQIKPYKKDCEYSYALGAFPTFELLKKRPEQVMGVYVHSTFTERAKVEALCAEQGIPVWNNDKMIARLSDKENVFVIGVFRKYEEQLHATEPHLMLVNPSNMGNAGTILRTCLAFGIHDIAVITPAVDFFNPKTVRASMGAIFSLRVQCFESFNEYRRLYVDPMPERALYSFMLTAEQQLTVENCPKPELYTLIFGNEATGLPEEYAGFTNSIIIPQSPEVDSLNLTIAVGIGAFLFRRN
ncbi:MAG: TrmH family RNA methyltransferase [Lachnospiraceae bacterium]|nr:TrmH family RNA methyltransferase [Lachnospiraceae bacterium]